MTGTGLPVTIICALPLFSVIYDKITSELIKVIIGTTAPSSGISVSSMERVAMFEISIAITNSDG